MAEEMRDPYKSQRKPNLVQDVPAPSRGVGLDYL